MDKAIGIFVFGMAIGGFVMILAEAYDNTKERAHTLSAGGEHKTLAY